MKKKTRHILCASIIYCSIDLKTPMISNQMIGLCPVQSLQLVDAHLMYSVTAGLDVLLSCFTVLTFNNLSLVLY